MVGKFRDFCFNFLVVVLMCIVYFGALIFDIDFGNILIIYIELRSRNLGHLRNHSGTVFCNTCNNCNCNNNN